MSKQKSQGSEELQYGNQDSNKLYSITDKEKDFYLVKHYETVGVNGDVPDPGTFRYQFYNPEIFEEYTREDENEGKENTFNLMGGKYEVLHNPSKNEPSAEPLKAFTVDGVKFEPSEDGLSFTSKEPAITVDSQGDYKTAAKAAVQASKQS